MCETNELVLSMMVSQLVKHGHETKKLLKRIAELSDSEEDSDSSVQMSFSAEETEKLNKIVLNILSLLNSRDQDCLDACKQYLTSLKSLLQSYPAFSKINMPDVIKSSLQDYQDSSLDESVDNKDILLSLESVQNILYK